MFTAGLVLTMMILPIVASLCRDLFLTVPRELKEGAAGTRGDPLGGDPRSGAAHDDLRGGAATVLGLGRALGEAIAVPR